ncbi:MAG: N-methyl-L-tryptophan oxidase [Pseudolabrys sp.]
MTEKFDTIVIGLGAMGAATLYQVAKRGRKILGIDRYSPPHAHGSSHGDTRITRLACGEGAVYTQFARRSHEIWRELEARTGEQLLVQNGLLVISGPGERASAHGNPRFLDSTIDASLCNDVPHEVLTDRDIRRRFPAFNITEQERGYYEPDAGFVFVEKCIETQLSLAKRLGATVHTNETMQCFDPRVDKVEVATDRATYAADNIVLAAGPWLPQLLPRRAALFTVRRQLLAWFRLADAGPTALARYRPDQFPVFYWQVPRKQAIYGFPWIGDGEPAIKLATEQYDAETTPDKVDRTASSAELQSIYADYIADFLPGVSGQCVKSAVCLYTCVDDARFIVDRLPEHPRVIVASPCSGHGFKHSAAIGEAIAELATDGTPSRVSLEEFRMPD